MQLSIIVPMLNETAQLPELFSHLNFFQQKGCEVIIVDGGSNDGSSEQVQTSGFTLLHSSCGRASQMNYGAQHAKGDVFLFLHADTRLPNNAVETITTALLSPQYKWGRFNVIISGKSSLFRMVAWFMNHRSRLTGIATGDQAIFIRREIFENLGGFPNQPLMEDIEISSRLKNHSAPACLTECVITSGRRWESQGVWRTIFLMWKLRYAYWRGISPQLLTTLYS